VQALCGIEVDLSSNVEVTNNTLGPGPNNPQAGISIVTPISLDPQSTNQTVQGNIID
jgi:hypothetical protein